MAEAKRCSRINELENELNGLEFLLKQLEQVAEEDVPSFLSVTGYASRQEVEAAASKVTQSLRKAKGEPKNEQAETDDKADPAEKFPLINIPDNMLSAEQVSLFFCFDPHREKRTGSRPILVVSFRFISSRKKEDSCF